MVYDTMTRRKEIHRSYHVSRCIISSKCVLAHPKSRNKDVNSTVDCITILKVKWVKTNLALALSFATKGINREHKHT